MPQGFLDPTAVLGGSLWNEATASYIADGTRWPASTPDDGFSCYDDAHSGGGQLQKWSTGGIPSIPYGVLTDISVVARLVGSSGKLPTHADIFLDGVSQGEAAFNFLSSGWYYAAWTSLSTALDSSLPIDFGVKSASSLIGSNYSGLNSGYVQYQYTDETPSTTLSPLVIEFSPVLPQKKLRHLLSPDVLNFLPVVPTRRLRSSVVPVAIELTPVAPAHKAKAKPSPTAVLLTPAAPTTVRRVQAGLPIVELTSPSVVTRITQAPSPLSIELTLPSLAFAGPCVCLSPITLNLTPVEIYYEPSLLPDRLQVRFTPRRPVVARKVFVEPIVLNLQTVSPFTPTRAYDLPSVSFAPIVPTSRLTLTLTLSAPPQVAVSPVDARPLTFGVVTPPVQVLNLTPVSASVVHRAKPAAQTLNLLPVSPVVYRTAKPSPLILSVVPTVRQPALRTAVAPLSVNLTPPTPTTVFAGRYTTQVVQFSPVVPQRKLLHPLSPVVLSVQIPNFGTVHGHPEFTPLPITLSLPSLGLRFTQAPSPLPVALSTPASALRLSRSLSPLPIALTLPSLSLRLSLASPPPLVVSLSLPAVGLRFTQAPSPLPITFSSPAPALRLSHSPLSLPIALTLPSLSLRLSLASPPPPAALNLSPQGILRLPNVLGPPDLRPQSDTGLYDDDDVTWARTVVLRWEGCTPGDRIFLAREGVLLPNNGYADANGRCEITYNETAWGPVRYAGAVEYPMPSPVLIGYWVNDPGSGNRSGIYQLGLVFNAPVTIGSAQDLVLTNLTTSATIDVTAATLSGNGTSELIFGLSGVTTPEGNYEAVVPTSAGTHIGEARCRFHRLIGDLNADRIVTMDDSDVVDLYFGQTGHPYIPGDANGNGSVSFTDHSTVQGNLGDSLPVP